MKIAALFSATFTLTSAAALAQSGSDALRACSLPTYEERMRCLEKLSGDVTPPPPPAGGSCTRSRSGNWTCTLSIC